MDLDLNEGQQLLRDTVRRICEATFDAGKIRALEAEDDKLNRPFWTELGAAGLCGLRIAEAHGGAAMSTLDLALVSEEFGRALASSPFLSSCILSASILASLAPADVQDEYLPAIAAGARIVIPAWDGNEADAALATIDSARAVLSGERLLVPFASVADLFLVHARGEGGGCWTLIPADASGVSIEAQPNYASQALFAVRFDDVEIDPARSFADGEMPGSDAAIFGDVLVAVAAEAVGAAERLLALTADYANQRQQFGRPIANFQAVSHPLAECATELEGARYLVYQAAWAKDGGMPHRHLAQMAKLKATSLFRRLATVSVQVHGGIGYSTEAEPQLFYRRSKFHELMYGTPAELRARISDHVFA
ncbi:acyl-CoA dehydrogenase family protein [Sphingosinicella sp.]|uniref:acyl-CoA dehydrogenase family protein n=1 Tax=Sphingosinicella sp. TaxID=1917971 RepID=UPI0035AFC77C